VIHVVVDDNTLCGWPWNYLAGKRKDKKVSIEKLEEATCSGCKKEVRKRGFSKPVAVGGK
jgi:hypothetical protein